MERYNIIEPPWGGGGGGGGEEREGGGVREGARKRQVAKNKEERERECGGGLQTKPISTWGVCSQKCLSPGGRGKGEEA